MAYDDFDQPSRAKPLIAAAAAIVAAGVGGWLYWRSHHAMPTVPAEVPPEAAAPAPEARIEHPVPAAPGAANAVLPDLNDSDKAVIDALGDAAQGSALAQYLVPENVIRHIVVTADNLPRQKIGVDKRPVTPAPGAFIADGDELHATLDKRNFRRYDPMVEVIRKADMQRMAAVYLRFYPLFQQAYQDLGYPTGYFNDRVVKVIDLLLATPQITGPIDLVRPNVMYVFADPKLEALPAGQKLLIRMGPDNAMVVKEKLMELRAIITAAPPKPSR
ncbi:MAG TPA: DUF3014 domain-containing protein [Steroidobacteraceae bacterium]|nr:DUF3014 domain-containing protein [Steroidobacteraceae bacterium]